MARGLLAGDGVVSPEDLLQDAWVVLLERPRDAETPRKPRAWFRSVLQKRAAVARRGEARRRLRERAVARDEAVPGVEEVTRRAALQRELAGHVLALEEPLRHVVLLRFFEGLKPPEVAERLGVPLKTVHSRQQRAFQRLRERLDRQHGSDARGVLALLALPLGGLQLPPELPTAPPTLSQANPSPWTTLLGSGLMQANLKLWTILGACALGGIGLWHLSQPVRGGAVPEPELKTEVVSLARPDLEAVERASSAPASSMERREVAAVDATRAAAAATPLAEATFVTTGRVVDELGRGVPDVVVGLAAGRSRPISGALDGPDSEVGRSDAEGHFSISWPESVLEERKEICLEVRDDAWVTVRIACVRETNLQRDQILFVARAIRLEGRVESVDGVPLGDALVDWGTGFGAGYVGFPHALDMTEAALLRTRTDAAGRFVFERFPQLARQELRVGKQGFVRQEVSLDEAPRPLVVRLVRQGDQEGNFVEGVVLGPQGGAIEGAEVRLAESTTKSDAYGTFRLQVPYLASATPLVATHSGYLPALVPNFRDAFAMASGEPFELVLGREPLAIEGRLVDQDGRACVGWTVSLLDETAVSQFRLPLVTAEGLVRGSGKAVRTGEDGGFRLEGLYPRSYLVQAYDKETLRQVEQQVQAGDTNVILRADVPLDGAVRGVVHSRDGEPLADVRVTLALFTYRSDFGSLSTAGDSVVTDASGRFAFEDVPRRKVFLTFDGEAILPNRYEHLEHPDVLEHEVELLRRCHFRIELVDKAAGIVRAQILDENGEVLQANRFSANGMSSFVHVDVSTEGASGVVSVAETAAEVLLLDAEGTERGRHAIRLVPGEVTVLRL